MKEQNLWELRVHLVGGIHLSCLGSRNNLLPVLEWFMQPDGTGPALFQINAMVNSADRAEMEMCLLREAVQAVTLAHY